MSKIFEKIKDYFSMTETSAYFGATEQKKAIQQDRAAQFLRGISEMTKGLYQQVRELRIIKERMQYYKDAEEGSEAAEIALKTVMDFIKTNKGLSLVRFVLFSDRDLEVYKKVLERLAT